MNASLQALRGRNVSPEESFAAMVDVLGTLCSYPVQQMHRDLELRIDLGLDSMDLMALTMIVEESIASEINPAEAENVRTIGQAADLLRSTVLASSKP
jgi:acyl carrier protein